MSVNCKIDYESPEGYKFVNFKVAFKKLNDMLDAKAAIFEIITTKHRVTVKEIYKLLDLKPASDSEHWGWIGFNMGDVAKYAPNENGPGYSKNVSEFKYVLKFNRITKIHDDSYKSQKTTYDIVRARLAKDGLNALYGKRNTETGHGKVVSVKDTVEGRYVTIKLDNPKDDRFNHAALNGNSGSITLDTPVNDKMLGKKAAWTFIDELYQDSLKSLRNRYPEKDISLIENDFSVRFTSDGIVYITVLEPTPGNIRADQGLLNYLRDRPCLEEISLRQILELLNADYEYGTFRSYLTIVYKAFHSEYTEHKGYCEYVFRP